MIKTRQDLNFFLKEDKKRNGISSWGGGILLDYFWAIRMHMLTGILNV